MVRMLGSEMAFRLPLLYGSKAHRIAGTWTLASMILETTVVGGIGVKNVISQEVMCFCLKSLKSL